MLHRIRCLPSSKNQRYGEQNFKIFCFSTFDLKSAYHQVPLPDEDKPYTAFEATSKLYEINSLPFRLTNGIAAFQCSKDNVIKEDKLEDTFAYVDNLTVWCINQEEHDTNLKALYETEKKSNMTFNHNKSIISATSIKLLGYVISKGSINPDPDHLKPSQKLPTPNSWAECWYVCLLQQMDTKVFWKNLSLDTKQCFSTTRKCWNRKCNYHYYWWNKTFQSWNWYFWFCNCYHFEPSGKTSCIFSRSLSEKKHRHPAVEKAYAIVESILFTRTLFQIDNRSVFSCIYVQ